MTLQELISAVSSSDDILDFFDTYSDVIFGGSLTSESDIRDEIPDTEWSVGWNGVFAADASGGEFIALEDGSIGFASSEGQADRIAENADDFLRLILFCPFWTDLTGVRSEMWFADKTGFLGETLDEYVENYPDYNEKREDVAAMFGIDSAQSALECAEKLYAAATREPRFYAEFSDDGEECSTEPLFI